MSLYKIDLSTSPPEEETFFRDIENPPLAYFIPGTRRFSSDKKIKEKKERLANAVSNASFLGDPSEPLRQASFKAQAQKLDSTTLFLQNCRTKPSFQQISADCHNTHLDIHSLPAPLQRPASSSRTFDALVKNIKSQEKQDRLPKTSKATNTPEEPLPRIPKINILSKISSSSVKPAQKEEKPLLIPKPTFEPPSPNKTTPVMQLAVPKESLDQKIEKVWISHDAQKTREEMAELQVAIGAGKLIFTPIEKAAKIICNSHPTVKQACKKTAIGVAKTIQEAKKIAYQALPPNAAENRKRAILNDAIYKEKQLGIPRETTLQHHENIAHYVSMHVISSALVLLPGIPKFKLSTKTTQFPKIPAAANSNTLPARIDKCSEISMTANKSNVISLSSHRNRKYASIKERVHTSITKRVAYNFHKDELVDPRLYRKVYSSDNIIEIFKSINYKHVSRTGGGSSHKKLIKDGDHVSIAQCKEVKRGMLKGYEKTYREAVKRDPKFSHLVLKPKEKISAKILPFKSKTERAISSTSKTVKQEAPKAEIEFAFTAPVEPNTLLLDSWHLSGFKEGRKRFESDIIAKRDIRQLNKGIELITQAGRFDEPIKFEKIMGVAAKALKFYAGKTKKEANEMFIKSLSERRAIALTLKNTREELPPIAQGRSSCKVFFVKDAQGNNLYVLKDFPALMLPESEFAREITAYKILKDLELKNWSLPEFHKIGKYLPEGKPLERGMLAMSYVDGQSLAMLKSSSEFQKAVQKVGMGLGEVHRKSYLLEKQPSQIYIQSEIEQIRVFYQQCAKNLKDSKIIFSLEENKLNQFIDDWIRNPGNTALVHGDVHLPNFIWQAETSKLYAIDPNSLVKAINANHHPIGCPTKDIMQAHVMLEGYGAKLGRPKKEIQASQQAFYEGYNAEFNLTVHSKEATEFYKLYFNLRSLMKLTHPEKFKEKEVRNLLERIKVETRS